MKKIFLFCLLHAGCHYGIEYIDCEYDEEQAMLIVEAALRLNQSYDNGEVCDSALSHELQHLALWGECEGHDEECWNAELPSQIDEAGGCP